MSKIYKDILVPIPENAYVNKCDARVYLVREKVYLPDMHYSSDKRKVVGRAVSEKEMYPNSTFRLLFPEVFNGCATKERVTLTTKIVGAYAAFLAMGKDTGLYELLVKSFGTQRANAIMDYAVYSILSNTDAAKDFRDAMGRYLLFSEGAYDGGWLSDFFKDELQEQQVRGFCEGWIARCREQGIGEVWICVDGGNVGYGAGDAEGKFSAENGKDGLEAAGSGLSYMWAVSANDGVPVTYRVGSGSQMDIQMLKEMCAYLETNSIAVKGVILGREFCNVDSLRKLSEEGIPYVVMLKEDAGTHKEMVEKYGKELRLNNVHYLIQRPGIYGVSQKLRLFPEEIGEAYVSLYYDSKEGIERVNVLTEKVKKAMDEALSADVMEEKAEESAGCLKYISVVRDKYGTKIGIDQEALQEDIDSAGFSSIASSHVMTVDEKDAVYRLRWASGEQVAILRAQVRDEVQEVLQEERRAARFAVGFIAGILRAEFENICRKLNADVDMMLKELGHLQITMLPGKGYRMMHTENGRQLALLKELGVWMSDLDDIAMQENRRMNGAGESAVRSLPRHGGGMVDKGVVC